MRNKQLKAIIIYDWCVQCGMFAEWVYLATRWTNI